MAEKKSIYVATHKFTELTKVGVSKNVTQRLKSFKTQVGYNLTLLYESPKIDNAEFWENDIKERFKEAKFEGEWFNISGERIMEYVDTIKEKFDRPEYESLYEDFREPLKRVHDIIDLPDKIIKVEEFIVRDENYGFYIRYNQMGAIKTAMFTQYKDALRFKTKHSVRLIPIL